MGGSLSYERSSPVPETLYPKLPETTLDPSGFISRFTLFEDGFFIHHPLFIYHLKFIVYH